VHGTGGLLAVALRWRIRSVIFAGILYVVTLPPWLL
jgi:hypothetical protein